MEDEYQEEPEEELEDDGSFENDFNSSDEPEENEPEETPEAEPAEEAESPAPVSPSFGFAPDADPDVALLQELLGAEAVAALGRIQQRELNRASESMALASIQASSAAAQNPELFRIYGPRIHQAISRLDPGLRARPESVHIAVASLIMEEASEKGLGPTLTRFASMMGAAPQKPTVRKEKTPIPPEQRPPSPGGGRQATEVPRSGREGRIQFYIKEFGMERGDAEALILSGKG